MAEESRLEVLEEAGELVEGFVEARHVLDEHFAQAVFGHEADEEAEGFGAGHLFTALAIMFGVDRGVNLRLIEAAGQ